jgi:hypothetical protein
MESFSSSPGFVDTEILIMKSYALLQKSSKSQKKTDSQSVILRANGPFFGSVLLLKFFIAHLHIQEIFMLLVAIAEISL